MRGLIFATFGAAVAIAGAGAAHPGGESGTLQYRATATYSDGTSADRLWVVRTGEDSDGDGVGDDTYLRVRCDGGTTPTVYHTVKSPRDAASGQATGKRMHKPFTITKQWDRMATSGKTVGWNLKENKGARSAGSGQAASTGSGQARTAAAGYDVKKVEGTGARVADGKTMAHDDWHEVTLAAGAPNLCD